MLFLRWRLRRLGELGLELLGCCLGERDASVCQLLTADSQVEILYTAVLIVAVLIVMICDDSLSNLVTC